MTRELKPFLNEEGLLKAYPSKRKMQIRAMFYLAEKFESGRLYTEKEVNQLLLNWHTFSDWAMLRRDLCDLGFLEREGNGSAYWLKETQPDPAAFGLL